MSTVIDLNRFKLGKTRSSTWDAKRLTTETPKIAEALSKVPIPPTSTSAARRRITDSIAWPMMGNDAYGDCTVAAAGHTIQFETTYEKHPATPTRDEVVSEYLTLTGGADNGLSLLDVLKPWQQQGLWGHKLAAYCELPLWPGIDAARARRALRLSVWLAGSAYLAFSLPAGMQKNPYDWTTIGAGPEWRAGSWGGHCVPAVYYIGRRFYVVTWGRLVEVSEAFLRAYCDEGWMPVSQDWVNTHGNTPNGRALTIVADIGQQLAA